MVFWFGRVTLLESRLIWIALSADQKTDTRKKISRCSSKSCINHLCMLSILYFSNCICEKTYRLPLSLTHQTIWKSFDVTITSWWRHHENVFDLNVRVKNITDGLKLRFQFIGSSWLNSPVDWVIYQIYWQRYINHLTSVVIHSNRLNSTFWPYLSRI